MKAIFYTLGSIGWLASIAGGLYLGIYVMLIGGIIQFIEAVKVTPVESYGVAIGVVKFFFAGVVGWLSFMLGAFVSSIFFSIGKDCR